MKKYLSTLTIITLSVFFFSSCKKKDRPDPVPPNLNIITEDSSGTLGRLTVRILYYSGSHQTSAAPSLTDVWLYETMDAFNDYAEMYETWTYQDDYTIDFGYLNPGTYYVYASTRIGGYDYNSLQAVQVNAGYEREYDIIMEKQPVE